MRHDVDRITGFTHQVEAWLREHPRVVPALLSAIAVAEYLRSTLFCYFNPDEAWKVSVADAPSWSAALSQASKLMHPPLLMVLERGLLALGSAEWLLRLPSMLFALGSLWFVWAWLRRTAGDAAGVAAMAFLVASPAMISAATEIREYAGLVFFATAALYFARRFVETPHHNWLAGLTMALGAGFLTHHATAWTAVALGIYVPLGLRRQGAARTFWLAWAGCQAALVALAAWTVFGYGDEYIAGAHGNASNVYWVQSGFPRSGEGVVAFVCSRVLEVWGRLVMPGAPGVCALVLFLVGIGGWLGAREDAAGGLRKRHEAVLLVAPFVVGLIVGWFGLYPFAALRQVDFVLPYAAAGCGIGLAAIVRQRVTRIVFLAILLLPLWLATTGPANDPLELPHANLSAALAALDTEVPAGEPLIVDNQTLFVLMAYWRDRPQTYIAGVPPTWSFGGRKVISSRGIWKLRKDTLGPGVVAPAHRLGRRVGASVWIASIGWGPTRSLAETLAPQFVRRTLRFGDITIQEIELMRFPREQD